MKNTTLPGLTMACLLAACGGSGAPAAASAPADAAEPSLLVHPAATAPAEVPQMPDSGAPAPAFALAGYAPASEGPQAALAGDATPDPQSLARPAARNLYVAPNGSDEYPGSASKPFRSIWRAARASRPGTKVFVAPGRYAGGFRTSASGTPDARIAFISSVKWGARIVPSRDGSSQVAWDNRGDHVDIVGFEIDGSGGRWTHGIYNGGSYDAIRNNHVHHIALANGCDHNGGAAIGVDSYYHGVSADVIANLVHDIGPPGCRFVQGIYVSTSARIKNNVVYRVAEGGIHLWHDARDVVITNNTITESNTGIIVGGGNFYYSKGPNDHTAVYSNIVFNNKMGISEQGKTGTGNSYRNNLVYHNSRYDWQLNNGLSHSGTVHAAPLFVASGSSPNLRPAAGSPAIGRASAEFAESTDFDGRPRNARAGYDIGAYQH